jgi:2-keto-4-pentenoate hydratase/2-oxohepta-3-ene-1,7-dioic acid hydratase in catechol pathway
MSGFLRYRHGGREVLGWGDEAGVTPVAPVLDAAGLPPVEDLGELIAQGPAYRAAAVRALEASAPRHALAEVELRAPLSPSAIICAGANFDDHLRETSRERATEVEFFFVTPSSVVGPGADVRMVEGFTKYDYEVELAIVIGSPARNVSLDDALSHVFGYTILNDVSARDHQILLDDDGTSQGRFGAGKSFRDSSPIGPWVVPVEQLPDPGRLALRTTVDAELRQNNTMESAIWGVAELVSYYSRWVTLQPGWVIACGTPGGPALGSDPELRADPYERDDGVRRGAYVQPGQLVECTIESIGTLANRYVR